MFLRHAPLAALLVGLAVLPLAGCGDDDSPVSPDGGPDAIADAADLAIDDAPGPRSEDDSVGVPPGMRTWEIVVENLTPATGEGSSQPFSPPVIAVARDRSVHMFRPGRRPGDELAQLAEDAINGPMVDRLRASRHVEDVVVGDAPLPPGATGRWMVRADRGRSFLSMAFMLVNTNDGFSGLDAVALPRQGEVSFLVPAWDAGSEQNTELAAHIPGPCCGSPGEGVDTYGRVRPHRGILGIGDLDPGRWGWDGPVARITIRALDPAWEVTLENLAPDTGGGGSQVLSPPVLATHGLGVRMFRVGRFATDELALLAEDGMGGPLADRLRAAPRTHEVVEGDAPIPPGASATFTVTGDAWRHRLSVATMLVNTNDGFTGADSYRLPAGGRAIWEMGAWDAGSEENTELEAHIPGPCCGSPGAGSDTHERIARHPGILGVGDLDPARWGWDDPVLRLTVTRVR